MKRMIEIDIDAESATVGRLLWAVALATGAFSLGSAFARGQLGVIQLIIVIWATWALVTDE